MKSALRISLLLAAVFGFVSAGLGQGSMSRYTTPAPNTYGRVKPPASPSTNGFTISAQRHFDNCVAMTVNSATRYWFHDLSAPSESLIAAGRYANATLWAQNSASKPGIVFANANRIVNANSGLLNARRIEFSLGGSMPPSDTSFSRYDEGQLAAWIQSNLRFARVDPVP